MPDKGWTGASGSVSENVPSFSDSRGAGALTQRSQQGVIVTPKVQAIVQPPLDFGMYGYLPGVAQKAQADIGNPNLIPQPYFTNAQLAVANWFTTRSVVKPIGTV